MKKADMSINFIFLIFMSLIVVFVIIGLVTKWSFNANVYMKKLFSSNDDDSNLLDKEIINVTVCNRVAGEVIKHAKLCSEKAQKGEVKGSGWTLCYAVLPPIGSPCGFTAGEIEAGLTAYPHAVDPNVGVSTNILVGYDYRSKLVTVR